MDTSLFKYSIIAIIVIVFSTTSCEKDKWEQTASTIVLVEESEDDDFEINNGKTELEEAQLNVSGMVFTGNRLQSDNPRVEIEKQLVFDFEEGEITPSFSIDIPQGNYDDMRLAFTSNSNNNFTMELDYEHPGQGQGQGQDKDYTIFMTFDINEIDPIQIKNEHQESKFLISADDNYSMSIKLDAQALFDGVPPGIWNAMISSNNNQQNIIEINENFNYIVKEKIEQNISKSIIIELK